MAPLVPSLITAVAGLLAMGVAPHAEAYSASEFSLIMRTESQNISLYAVDAGYAGGVNLVGAHLNARHPGTPVVQSGTSPNAQLSLNLNGHNDPFSNQTGTFNIIVPDIGEVEGTAFGIGAETGATYSHFYTSNTTGQVLPQLTAGDQLWLACDVTIQGFPYIGLSFGNPNENGSWPYGCEPAQVYMAFDIPRSNS